MFGKKAAIYNEYPENYSSLKKAGVLCDGLKAFPVLTRSELSLTSHTRNEPSFPYLEDSLGQALTLFLP